MNVMCFVSFLVNFVDVNILFFNGMEFVISCDVFSSYIGVFDEDVFCIFFLVDLFGVVWWESVEVFFIKFMDSGVKVVNEV